MLNHSTRFASLLLAFALLALVAVGTPGSISAEPSAPSEADKTDSVTGSQDESSPEAVDIVEADKEQFAAFIKEHRGKVIFVDFWATWCAACIEEFPHTVELHRKYADRGLVVASMSLDDLEEKEQAKEFLREQQAGFANWISTHGGGDESFTHFEIANGALPHYKLYDRTGKLVKTFNAGDPVEKPFTAEEVEVSVRELLDAPAAKKSKSK